MTFINLMKRSDWIIMSWILERSVEKYDEEGLKFVNCKGQIWAVCLENVGGARQGAKVEWPGTSYRGFVCLWKLDKVVGFSIFLKLFWSRKHVPVSQHSFLYHGVLNNKFNGENTRPALFVNMISKLGTRYLILSCHFHIEVPACYIIMIWLP